MIDDHSKGRARKPDDVGAPHANAELTCLKQQSLPHHTLVTLPLEAGDGDGTEGVSSTAF